VTAKTRISSIPSQKFGTENRPTALPEMPLSSQRRRVRAASEPSTMPPTVESRKEGTASASVLPTRLMMRSSTGSRFVAKE
jgi:hypothetical protein